MSEQQLFRDKADGKYKVGVPVSLCEAATAMQKWRDISDSAFLGHPPDADGICDMNKQFADAQVETARAKAADKLIREKEAAKPKTRGEEVAEKSVTSPAYRVVAVCDGNGQKTSIVLIEHNKEISERLRRTLASLIDAEIARAKAEEREACAQLIQSMDAAGRMSLCSNPSAVASHFVNAIRAHS